jgi:uncharacterized membrane protein YadS
MNWLFFFTSAERDELNRYKEVARGSLTVWFIFSILGSLLPVIIAFITNLLINNPCNWLQYINNGAIPIVSYSIIVSAIFYLLDSTQPALEVIRKKVLGISIILLFVNISLLTLLTVNQNTLGVIRTMIIFIATILFLCLSIYAGRTMVMLQKSIINNFRDTVDKTRKNVTTPTNKEDDGIQY